MNTNFNSLHKISLFVGLILLLSTKAFAQTTTILGLVRDSVTGERIESATIRFENSAIGGLSEEDGSFKFSNRQGKNNVIVSFMGYETWTKTVTIGTTTMLDVKLVPIGVKLDEVVIRPEKEKYSKKNNPAVELIKKVISNKNKYLVSNQNYYQSLEYERLVFALNDFDETKAEYRGLSSLAQYKDTSLIDNKPILPISVRETASSFYYRKDPSATKRIVEGHKMDGIDAGMDVQAIDAVVKEIFQDINITDNNINLFLKEFVSPLNTDMSVDFYRWYIIDTVTIDQKRYVNLGFVPFNTRDVGFIGNLYVSTDTSYAIKRLTMRVPKNINLNFVDAISIEQEFDELSANVWIPKHSTMAVDMSVMGTLNAYVEKTKVYSNFVINQPVDIVFLNPEPVIYLSDYKKRTNDFWQYSKPTGNHSRDYKVDLIMAEIKSNKFLSILLETINIFSKGYIPIKKDPEENKLSVGTPLTFFSFNGIEGARFRLSAMTTPVFHDHLFLNGYAAFGTKDLTPKYMAEATWSFKKRKYNKEEFPVHGITLAYKYDLNALGQRYLRAERDNILMSGLGQSKKMTYARMAQLTYKREFYNGFSFNIFGRTQKEQPAGELSFIRSDEFGNTFLQSNITSTEVGAEIRIAPGEKFFQQNFKRRRLPYSGFVYTLGYTAGINTFDGNYKYHKLQLDISRELWLSQFGKLYLSAKAEKLWGEAPFPTLITPNANTSFTVQQGAFNLIDAMEFINDEQFSCDLEYHMGGWLLNRIPIIKAFKFREVFGFRGFWGKLSDRNNPSINHDLILFPNNVSVLKSDPYMEYNIGIENIFSLFRVDYVRRINYLNHPGIDKDGFRIGFEFSF